MILRNKKISTSSDIVQLHVSFSSVDVKGWLRYYAWLYERDTESGKQKAQSIPQNEIDLRYWFEHEPRALANWETKWREQLSAWAWATAVRCGFLVQSVTPGRENEFYLADCLFKKIGRPAQNEVG